MLVDTKKLKVFINIFFFYNIHILLPRKKRGGEIMGRPKGGKNRTWTSKEKYEIILPVLNGELSTYEQASIVGVKSHSTIVNWIHKYQDGGIEALENKRKPGNPLAKYSSRKELSYTEQLEYENMKLRIENERLKKGYTSKEADQAKKKKSSKKNLK